MSDDKAKLDFLCSFCGKARQDVEVLISGPRVFICDECVKLCAELIAEERAKGFPSKAKKPRNS